MRDFFSSTRFKILAGVFAFVLGMFIYAAANGGVATMPQRLLSAIVTPVEKAATVVTEGIIDFFSPITNAKKNAEENEALKARVAELLSDLADYEATKEENMRLREVLDLKEQNSDIHPLDAGVIARDPTDAYGSFTIDKGSVHGVELRDPVITGEGLVGYVSFVGGTYSKVTTILSPSVNVGALEITTRETGNLTGTVTLAEKGCCLLELLPTTTAIEPGQIIVTAGSGGYFPPELVIGTVEEVYLEESGITCSASIRPAVEIDEISYVFVITEFLGQTREVLP